MPLAVCLLAVAVFAMGTSEFMIAGLLPDIAADLHVTVGTAGTLTSAFALGMAVGAPLMAALARTWPRRSSLLTFVLVFLAAHVVGATAGSFPVLFATRTVAALANAGFLAMALATAVALVPPDRTGRALAVLLSGTTVATVAGVPAGSALGTVHGWRTTFWAVAVACLPAAIGILKGVPVHSATEDSYHKVQLRRELAQLRRPPLMMLMLLGTLVNAATFGGFTFLAPVVTQVAGLGDLWISVVLVVFGAGSFAGVAVAGRLSDRCPDVVVATAGPMLVIGWVALAILAQLPIALLVLVFVQGVLSFAVGGTLIARILRASQGAPTMGGSYATAALNVGAVAGPLLAAGSRDTVLADVGPLWTSGLLVALALLVAVAATLPRSAANFGHPLHAGAVRTRWAHASGGPDSDEERA